MYAIYPLGVGRAVKSTKEKRNLSCEFLKSLFSGSEFLSPQHELSELWLITVVGCQLLCTTDRGDKT